MGIESAWRPALLVLAGLGAWAGEGPVPMPPLPPEPRALQLTPGGGAEGQAMRAVDRHELAKDIQALRLAVDRVEAALRSSRSEPLGGPVASGPAVPAAAGPEEVVELASPRFTASRLRVRRTGGQVAVWAALDAVPCEDVVSELAALAGQVLDLRDAPGIRRPVVLRVAALPLGETLDRLLGQLGLVWSEEASAGGRRLVVLPAGARGLEPKEAERAEVAALERAARDERNVVAAEARYLLARRETLAGRPAEAMRRYNELVEAFGDEREPGIRAWVQLAIRGIADSMLELKQFREARSVYRNYIARTDPADPQLPAVLLATAEVSRKLGVERNDPVAIEEAVEDLHTLLERFAAREGMRGAEVPEVALARLALGGLLFDQGRWQEAAVQLERWGEASGRRANDRVDAWRAECYLQLGRTGEALALFERLHDAWRGGRSDGQVPEQIYQTAAFRIGLCHLRGGKPDPVSALLAFQKAMRDFPRASLDAEQLVAITSCWAQIEREDKAVETLWQMMQVEAAPGRARLDQFFGALLGRLVDYPGPVRARVSFYIAQATWHRAERERGERAALATQAVGYYERTLADDPPGELRDAARLGLARAALLAGNEERAVRELEALRRDATVAPRDREYANRLLGDHWRAKGDSRAAIRAYRGE